MGTDLILKGSGGDLLIELAVDDFGWSLCSLIGDSRVYLGAETADYLLPRLLDTVDGGFANDTPLGEIEGHSVYWALSLSEAHHALYVARDGSDTLLLWQNAQDGAAALSGTMRLSPEQCRQWGARLRTAYASYEDSRTRRGTVTRETAEALT